MKKLTENQRRHLGETISIRWGTSRGRDTYGYTTYVLRNDRGVKVAGCNGGGYDMRGTVVGHWITAAFPDELRALKPKDMPENSHWQHERARICADKCHEEAHAKFMDALAASCEGADKIPGPDHKKLAEDCWECPVCGGKTVPSRDGKRIDDGHYFYGLTFHDPNYDPGKAVIGKDCTDRTLTKKDGQSEGKTVEQAEKENVSFGLERLQAVYRASCKHATKRHTIPSIDGACGFDTVLKILNAIGLTLRKVHDTSKLDVYSIEQYKKHS